jgi:hypothetical protein
VVIAIVRDSNSKFNKTPVFIKFIWNFKLQGILFLTNSRPDVTHPLGTTYWYKVRCKLLKVSEIRNKFF